MALSSERLELLLQVAGGREDEARRLLADAEKRETEQAAIIRELEKYLAEYEARPLAQVSPVLLENRRQFHLKLQAAIAQSQRSLLDAQARTARAREAWLATRREVKVNETLLEGAQAEDRRAADRRAQRELDEFAARPRGHAAVAS